MSDYEYMLETIVKFSYIKFSYIGFYYITIGFGKQILINLKKEVYRFGYFISVFVLKHTVLSHKLPYRIVIISFVNPVIIKESLIFHFIRNFLRILHLREMVGGEELLEKGPLILGWYNMRFYKRLE